jgi:DNA-binding transcriptional LysR family regulator
LSKAAQQISISQSAASHALAKLREQLGDPLFTRTRSGFQPTPFGIRVSSASSEAMDLLQASLASNNDFDPMTSTRVFRFYMNDVGQTVFLPHLLPFLKTNAPLVTLRVLPIPLENPGAAMSSGEVDFAAGAFNNLTSGFFQHLVLRERHVCIVRSGDPRFRAGMSLEAFTETDQVLADATGMSTTGIIDRFLRKNRVRREVVLRVPQFHVLPAIVADSDLLAIVPKRLADAFASRLPIKILPLPIAVPTFDICIHWHERYHHDPAIRWMRRAFVDLFAKERRQKSN